MEKTIFVGWELPSCVKRLLYQAVGSSKLGRGLDMPIPGLELKLLVLRKEAPSMHCSKSSTCAYKTICVDVAPQQQGAPVVHSKAVLSNFTT